MRSSPWDHGENLGEPWGIHERSPRGKSMGEPTGESKGEVHGGFTGGVQAGFPGGEKVENMGTTVREGQLQGSLEGATGNRVSVMGYPYF